VQNAAKDKSIKKLQDRNTELAYQLREAQKLTELFRTDKESLENELIGKFLAILHTKQVSVSESLSQIS
jgi:hypothetical protein